MGYTNPEFLARFPVPQAFALSLSTATASGANALVGVATLPKTFRRVKVSKVRLRCTTIPDSGSTNYVVSFLNGTNTFATVAVTTATVGQILDGTVTATNAIIAADTSPTINVSGTATASGDANGAYDVWFEVREEYA